MYINQSPTTEEELNTVLVELVIQIQNILKDNFLAAYLQGSFAHGGWDEQSDVDFLIVIDQDLSETEVAQLQEMHPRIHQMDSYWAKHLEGSYFPKDLLRYEDLDHTPIWYLDNGATELIRHRHDNELVVRWVVRERGITLAGPPPAEFIAPIDEAALKNEVRTTMRDWGEEILTEKYSIANGWAQPFAVISYCRMLQTLATGEIHSKPAGVEWGQKNLDSRWSELIQTAWEQRLKPTHTISHPVDLTEVQKALKFIRYALDLAT